jgi:signal transduction histidine kinase
MSLRTKLSLIALSVLALPWAGWQLLGQMEALLRQGQEQALVASAEALARAVAVRPDGVPPPAPTLYVAELARMPRLDGDFADWAGVQRREFPAADGTPRLSLWIARAEDSIVLAAEMRDATPKRADAHWPLAAGSDHLQLSLDGSVGLIELRLANAASGALIVTTLDDLPAPLRVVGEWRERGDGYAIEMRLPQGLRVDALGLHAIDVDLQGRRQQYGIGRDTMQRTWPLVMRSERLARPLRELVPPQMRARLVDTEGWILAEAGGVPRPADERTDADLAAEQPEAVRSEAPELWQALSGVPATAWRRDDANARVVLAAAVPVRSGNAVRGAVLLESAEQTLLQERATSRVILTSLAALLAAGVLVYVFASRLSDRIRRLRDATENAFDRDGKLRPFPRSTARDEIGDLSRSFARLLDEVAANQDYLRSLAGKLSHELNTPLAIMRGALDNIDDALLHPADRTCIERARGGGERLAGIVRAMSEASRIERAIANADAEDFDLRAMLKECAAGYRELLAPRELLLELPDQPVPFRGAPELIVQALDKLVDNARGFTPDDGWVRIALERGTDGLHVVVANRGPLLPDAMRHRLFESLVSVRPGGHSGVHLGFGLFVVRLVAELHRGAAEARNLPAGDGVEFALRLKGR